MDQTLTELLDYIAEYKDEHDGVAPSLDDIKDHFGYSKATARDRRDKLVELGKITHQGGLPRTIEVAGGYREYLGAEDEAGLS